MSIWELQCGAQLWMLWGCSWAEVTIPCCCALQERAETITTFALCGFANLSSIGITLGGLSECDPCPGCPGIREGNPGPGNRSSAEAGGICCLQASMFSLCQIRKRICMR